jgi:ribosomal protein S12 methylthiotransferase
MAGRELDVLVERGTRRPDGEAMGRTVYQAPDVDGVTYVRGAALRRGQVVRVRIDEAIGWDLHGHVAGSRRPAGAGHSRAPVPGGER